MPKKGQTRRLATNGVGDPGPRVTDGLGVRRIGVRASIGPSKRLRYGPCFYIPRLLSVNEHPMTPIADAASRLRRPEHTGENRCTPCTILNVLIAAATAAVLATVSVTLGTLSFLVALLAIYLRGYLVPGTPRITRRYFPAPLLRAFGKQPSSSGVTISDLEGVNEALAAVGILVPASNATYRLASAFREEWRDRIRAVRSRNVTPEEVATLFDADEIDRYGETSFVLEKNKSLRWNSRAALVADVAAGELLRSAFDDWGSTDATTREDVFRRLRLLLDRCPRCDGPVATDEHHVDPCCQRPYTVVESFCRSCNEVLTAIDVPDTRAESWRELGVLEARSE